MTAGPNLSGYERAAQEPMVLDAFIEGVQHEYDREGVALVDQTGMLWPLRNSAQRGVDFEVDGADVQATLRVMRGRGLRCEALLHTHVEREEPSNTDTRHYPWWLCRQAAVYVLATGVLVWYDANGVISSDAPAIGVLENAMRGDHA